MDDGWHPRDPERGGGRGAALLLVVALAVAGFLGFRADLLDAFTGPERVPAEVAPPAPPLDPAVVAATVGPALVNIAVTLRPFGAAAAGSGIVLGADGEVLTSHHVVKGAETVLVTDVGTGVEYSAEVLGYDATADIALLALTGAGGLPTARLGSSARLRLRDEVLALGNAGGVGGTPTAVAGRITDLNSTIVAQNSADLSRLALRGMVEVAAAVTAGQSGGALADRNGDVVGVITAASGQGGEPVPAGRVPNGYAVPIDRAMTVVKQIRAGVSAGTVHVGPTATLGVLISDAADGARLDVVLYGTPAWNAGLADGSVVVAVDGRPIADAKALRAEIDARRPADVVRLEVLENGGRRVVEAVLAESPPR
ncbi:S1C family serine protease [Nocardia sp. NPDC057227]|uniref:S1C family serine protease n=1 Tax=Nocardia sp. NPDC057227 TaxID=3346056 RepID=UPI0036405CC2